MSKEHKWPLLQGSYFTQRSAAHGAQAAESRTDIMAIKWKLNFKNREGEAKREREREDKVEKEKERYF